MWNDSFIIQIVQMHLVNNLTNPFCIVEIIAVNAKNLQSKTLCFYKTVRIMSVKAEEGGKCIQYKSSAETLIDWESSPAYTYDYIK